MSSREYDIAPVDTDWGVRSKERIVWDHKTGLVTVIEDEKITAEIDFKTLVSRVSQLANLSDEAFEELMHVHTRDDFVLDTEELTLWRCFCGVVLS